MKSIFDESEYKLLIARVEQLAEHSVPHWGKMDAAQMLHHLNCAIEASIGKYQVKDQSNFLVKLFKSVLYNDRPFGKGIPHQKDLKL